MPSWFREKFTLELVADAEERAPMPGVIGGGAFAKSGYEALIAAQSGLVEPWIDLGLPAIGNLTKCPRNLTVIGAATSNGKSITMLNILIAQIEAGRRVGLVGLEDSPQEIYESLISNLIGVNNRLFTKSHSMSQHQLSDTLAATDQISSWGDRLQVLGGAESTTSLPDKVAAFRRAYDLDVVLIDHSGKLQTDIKFATKSLGGCFSRMQSDSVTGGYHLIVFAQLNREAPKREGHWPLLTDLRDSGEVEIFSRVVILINRPEVYYSGLGEKCPKEDLNHVYYRVAKATRGGEVGTVTCGIAPQFSRVFECRCESLGIRCTDRAQQVSKVGL